MRDVGIQRGGINGDKQDIRGKGGGEGAEDGILSLNEFLLLLTSTSNPSSSPYLHTLKILTTSFAPPPPPSLQHPACHH